MVILDVLVSVSSAFRRMLPALGMALKGLQTSTSIARISKRLNFHPQARLLDAPCGVDVFLVQVALCSSILIASMECATMSKAVHDRNTFPSCVQRESYLDHARSDLPGLACVFHELAQRDSRPA